MLLNAITKRLSGDWNFFRRKLSLSLYFRYFDRLSFSKVQKHVYTENRHTVIGILYINQSGYHLALTFPGDWFILPPCETEKVKSMMNLINFIFMSRQYDPG